MPKHEKEFFKSPLVNSNQNPRIDSTFLECIKSEVIVFGDLLIDPSDNTIKLSLFVPLLLKTKSSTEKTAILELVVNPYTRFYDIV